jgi:hypothetical protein
MSSSALETRMPLGWLAFTLSFQHLGIAMNRRTSNTSCGLLEMEKGRCTEFEVSEMDVEVTGTMKGTSSPCAGRRQMMDS